MNLKLIIGLSLFTVMPALAQAQTSGAPANAPKPTKADVQKVVQMISGDKSKLQAYCDLGKLSNQMAEADEKKDTKAVAALGPKIDSLTQKLGPDYVKLMDGLDLVDPSSPEGKEVAAAFDPLDKQCK